MRGNCQRIAKWGLYPTSRQSGVCMQATGKTDRRILKTNAAIREAFGRLASQGDFRKISITALASEANIDRKTFYLHYRSIDELIEEMVRERAEEMADEIRRALAKREENLTAADLLRELIAVSPAKLQSDSSHLAIHAPLEDILDHLEKPLSEALMGLWRSQMPDTPVDECRLRYTVAFVVAGSLAVYKRWLAEQPDITLEELVEMNRAVMLASVAGLAHGLK